MVFKRANWQAMMEMQEGANALSWQEVQDICGKMEQTFRLDAQNDAQRLRSLVQKRKAVSAACRQQQASAKQQLQLLQANVQEWEQNEADRRATNERMQQKIEELDQIKRQLTEQLERLRVDEQLSKEAIEDLLDKYEETRQQALEYTMVHQNDLPLAKHQMSLYAAVTGIKWDFSGSNVAGEIHVPATQTIAHFEIDPDMDHFEAANALWDKIDDAFDDLDSDL